MSDSTDEAQNRAQYVSTPSERFTSTGEAITRGEWERRQLLTYGAAGRRGRAAS